MKKSVLSFTIMIIFFVIGLEAKTISDLQDELYAAYNVNVVRSNTPEHLRNVNVTDEDFHFFLRTFLNEAKKQDLAIGERKRFFPVQIDIQVVPENRHSGLRYASSYLQNDVELYNNKLFVGHRSAAGAVKFVIERFPLEGTREALEMYLRNKATRQAIMDLIADIKSKGVFVESCIFAAHICSLNSPHDIAYPTQEQLLQGLINLRASVESGEETRSIVNIEKDYVVRLPIPKRFFPVIPVRSVSWNRWFVDDEELTQEMIFEYMKKLNSSLEVLQDLNCLQMRTPFINTPSDYPPLTSSNCLGGPSDLSINP